MSNRDEIDVISMFLRMMNGESDVVEHMEAEGQDMVINHTMVARKMNPSKEVWEQIGFKFTDIPGDNVLCYAELPDGWHLEKTDHSMHNRFIDEQGRVRGTMFYKAAFYDRDANMCLMTRYNVKTDLSEGINVSEIYFGNENEKLFVAGKAVITNEMSRDERLAVYDEVDKLKEIARAFGEEYYPNYLDPTAYWNDEKDLTDSPKKIRK